MLSGFFLLAVAPLLPWFRTRLTGGEYESLGGLASGDAFWPAVLAWILVLILALDLVIRPTNGRVLAIASALVGAVLAGMTILASEALVAVLKSVLFNSDVVDLGASYGPWTALAACLLMLAGLTVDRWWGRVFLLLPTGDERSRYAFAVPMLFVMSIVALIWLRYQPWLTVSAEGLPYRLHVRGWGTAGLGPISFSALVLLIASLISLALGRLSLAAMLAGLGAWTFTFLSAGVVLGASSIGLLPIDDWTLSDFQSVFPEASGDESLDINISWQIWAMWAVGMFAVGSALWWGELALRKKRRR